MSCIRSFAHLVSSVFSAGNLAPEPSAIQLVWPSNPEDAPYDNDLRIRVWNGARRVFFHHLLPCTNDPCPLGPHIEALSKLEDPLKLIETLRELKFHNLADNYVFPDAPNQFVAFLRWVGGKVRSLQVDFG